ncbi:MAG: iron-containing alcohol dehydrogenase [Thermoleophilaceae bacterium]|nr:iron-containing alcohol dehydrogenase [Thermoleophilaceae bacterium]
MSHGFKDFYQWASATRVIAGRGLIESTGFEFAKEGARRVLVVTDPGVHGTGLVERVEAGLADGGLETAGVFQDVPQDSDTAVVERVAEQARAAGADSFLAVGGGSVMDTAKAADVVFTHGGRIRDWEGFYVLPREQDGLGRPLPLAPLACIPTTAGTGSEVSFAAVVRDVGASLKMEVADFPLFPRLAILDPDATSTLPAPVAAATGMDALTHAVEGYVSSEWSAHGDAFALHALRLIHANLEPAVLTPQDEDARGNMLVAASLAIVPTGSGAIGIAHSMSHACGGRYGVAHGVANAVCLPHVIRFNALAGAQVVERYADLARLLGLDRGADEAVEALAEHLERLRDRLGLPARLSGLGVPEDGISLLAEAAMGDVCTLVNPREPSREDFEELFRRAL